MIKLDYPAPLDARLFHSKQAIQDYDAACAAYEAQIVQAEYAQSKQLKRKHPSHRQQYLDQD